jgi:hypothetical protein
MILRHTQEVAQELLPSGVLIPRDNGCYAIKYKSTAVGAAIRVIVAALFVGGVVVGLATGHIASPKAIVGTACIAVLAVLIGASYPRVIIDANARCVRRGWALFNRFGDGLSRVPIRDPDRVRIQVRTHDGEDRHNPLYEVVIHRPALFRPDIVLIVVAFPPSDPEPSLIAFAELVGRLLNIEHDQKLRTA